MCSFWAFDRRVVAFPSLFSFRTPSGKLISFCSVILAAHFPGMNFSYIFSKWMLVSFFIIFLMGFLCWEWSANLPDNFVVQRSDDQLFCCTVVGVSVVLFCCWFYFRFLSSFLIFVCYLLPYKFIISLMIFLLAAATPAIFYIFFILFIFFACSSLKPMNWPFLVPQNRSILMFFFYSFDYWLILNFSLVWAMHQLSLTIGGGFSFGSRAS